MFQKRAGFTLLELLLAIGVVAILATVSIVNLTGRRGQTELDGTAQQVAALLHDAQSRAVAQASGASWGVHFENKATGPFYALFSGAYAPTNTQGYYRLPATVRYRASALPVGNSAEVVFAQITGFPAAPASVIIESISGTSSSTITVSAAGLISMQ